MSGVRMVYSVINNECCERILITRIRILSVHNDDIVSVIWSLA